ncbi:MAG: DUF4235 domain-containing protein [Streptosporangiaceae bacterium]
MADKNGDIVSRAVSGVAGAAAAFGARKAMSVAWKRVAGKEPPESPEDPAVSLAEALVWALLVGAVVNTAKMLAVRVANRRQSDAG